ncbi:sodium/glutamate symporter [Paraglaciecola sp. Hal342]
MPGFHLDAFDAYTVAIIVFFVGKHLNTRINLLRTYNIPRTCDGRVDCNALYLGIISIWH